MQYQFSDRVNQFKPGVFAMLNDKKEELLALELYLKNIFFYLKFHYKVS